MTWMDGKLEIFQIFPDKEWLERKGISEETIDDFEDVGVEYKELPFKQGNIINLPECVKEVRNGRGKNI